MKSGYYLKLSPTRLAVLDCCDYYGEGFIITRINVPKEFRGQGKATELLKLCLADADKSHTILWLEISSSDGLNYDQLEAWYKRHGFKGNSIFRRLPQTGDYK